MHLDLGLLVRCLKFLILGRWDRRVERDWFRCFQARSRGASSRTGGWLSKGPRCGN
jgi:hypothetical protein